MFLWDSDYPWDIRVEKICATLRDAGWKMHLVCRNRARRPREEVADGICLHRLGCLPPRWGRLNDVYGFPFFLSPV
nr:hypothetical protein [Desulfobacteraceae bacterium]